MPSSARCSRPRSGHSLGYALGRHLFPRVLALGAPRASSVGRRRPGEPLVKHLPRMVRYLKDRGTYVLFNANGTVLNDKNGRALIEADLDELRVSFDAANAESYRAIRGKNYFNRILKNVRAFRDLQERARASLSRGYRRG
jgi:hypothetical protein